jgi:hypothetical protein
MSYSKYISNSFLRFLYSFFVQMPITIWFRFLTAYWPTGSSQFVNDTSISDSVLMQQWTLAQQGLATAPFPLDYSGGSVHAADPRVLDIKPQHVTVVSVPDIPVATLASFDKNWVVGKDKDPSGTIVTSENVNCHSFACCWRKPRVYAACSEIPVTLSYEFQNIILDKLGYDVSGR